MKLRRINVDRQRLSSFLFSILAWGPLASQTPTTNLEVPAKGNYEITTDTLVLQELILNDGAVLTLNNPGTTTYLHVERVIIGANTRIIGKGSRGENGATGKDGAATYGVCKDGLTGGTGEPGKDGTYGKNLFIDVAVLEITGAVGIDLSGGNGGDGGDGGKGSHGARATSHCSTNGGEGGQGGAGGSGGQGGSFSLNCTDCLPGKELMKVITLVNNGGYAGYGGYGGKGGMQGSGSATGKSGATGKTGPKGQKGNDGKPLYYTLIKETAMKE